MLCPNCKKSIVGTNGECEYCGTPLVSVSTGEESFSQSQPKVRTLKEKMNTFFFIIFWIVMIYFGIVWLQQRNEEKKFNQRIYQEAVTEVRSHLGNSDSVDIADFKNEYVNIQEWDYHDFGYGNLRYGRYEVIVPIEYDDYGNNYTENVAINVYYYTSNQNVLEGIDTSVPDHLYTPDMFQERWDKMFEGVELPTFE